jgi:uncharacterized protein YigE (DUF2233 family)
LLPGGKRLACCALALLLAGCQALGIRLSDAPTPVVGTPLPTWAGVVNPLVTNVAPYTPPPIIPTVATIAGQPTTPGVINPGNVGGQGWSLVTAAIALRQLTMPSGNTTVPVVVTRLDPTRVSFQTYYTPGVLHTLSEWRSALPTSVLLVNANYFNPQNMAIGLVVSNSNSYGGYINRADSGLFQIVGGRPRVRSLWLEPYNASERLEQAVQGFPILAAQGQAAPISPDLDQGSGRRTVVALDRQGRVLFLITPLGGVTLSEMARWLVSGSGLDIDTALNLDGGRSTQMFVGSQSYPGLTGLPLMIAVFSR